MSNTNVVLKEANPSNNTTSLYLAVDNTTSKTEANGAKTLTVVKAHPLQHALARSLSDILHSDNLKISRATQIRTILRLNQFASKIAGLSNSDAIANVTQTEEELTPLHLLSQINEPEAKELVKDLAKAGAELLAAGTIKDTEGNILRTNWTPLHNAILHRSLPVVEGLCELIPLEFINTPDSCGQSALRLLFEYELDAQLYQIAECLLAHKANINYVDHNGASALSKVITKGDWEAAYFLLQHGANLEGINSEQWQSVTTAIQEQVLTLTQSAKWNDLNQLLDILDTYREVWGTQSLISWLNRRAGNNSEIAPFAINFAALNSAPADTIRKLIQCGADVHSKCCLILELDGKQVIRENLNNLHLAAYSKNPALVEEFIQDAVDVKALDSANETPMFLAIHHNNKNTGNKSNELQVIRKLKNAGTPINQINIEGRNCPDLCVLKAFWRELGEMEASGGRLCSISKEEIEKASIELRKQLISLAIASNWQLLDEHLDALSKIESLQDTAFVANIMNININKSVGSNLCMTLAKYGAPPKTLELADQLGADFTALGEVTFQAINLGAKKFSDEAVHKYLPRWTASEANFIFPGASLKATNVSVLHAAAMSGNPSTLLWFKNKNFSHDARDSLGNPISFYAYLHNRTNNCAEQIRATFEYGTPAWAANHNGVTLFDLILAKKDIQTLLALSDSALSAQPRQPIYKKYWYSSSNDRDQTHVAQIQLELLNSVMNSRIDVLREGMAVLHTSRNLELALWYIRGSNEALNPSLNQSAEDLARLVPAVMTGLLPRSIFGLVAHNVEYNDSLSKAVHSRHGYHPNLAELTATLLHPNDPTSEDRFINVLTSSLTSTTQLWKTIDNVNETMLANLGWLGLRCFSFQELKHDTRRITFEHDGQVTNIPSLFEQYLDYNSIEAKTIKDNHSSKYYGNGFLILPGERNISYTHEGEYGTQLIKLDPRTLIILRQGHYIISHPEHGTLSVRNSSPIYVRNGQQFPLMWSHGAVNKGFSPEFLINTTPETLHKHFANIFSPELNHQKMRLQDHLTFLRRELRGLLEHYHAWSFDTRYTTAWERIDKNIPAVLKGGHFSPGFKARIDMLHALNAAKMKLPSLAFKHPDYTSWNRFEFKDQNIKKTTLEITPLTLSLLTRLANGDPHISQVEMQNSGVQRFFNDAGLKNAGSQLIFVDN
jgi:ankyrin repeat protein